MAEIITEVDVRRVVEPIVEEELVFRGAFRELSVAMGDNPIRIPRSNDVLGEPAEVGKASEYPSGKDEFETVDIDRHKYGFKTPIAMEDEADHILDLAGHHVEFQARKLAEFLDSQAYSALDSNNTSSSVTADDALDFADVVDTAAEMEGMGYDPDRIITNPAGKADLLKSDDFNRASDLGDSTVTTGLIGDVAGLDVFYSNTGDLTDSNAFMIDTSLAGYEATWANPDTDSWEDTERQVTFYRTWLMKYWSVMDSNAVFHIDA